MTTARGLGMNHFLGRRGDAAINSCRELMQITSWAIDRSSSSRFAHRRRWIEIDSIDDRLDAD
jgi:hypothetical protein